MGLESLVVHPHASLRPTVVTIAMVCACVREVAKGARTEQELLERTGLAARQLDRARLAAALLGWLDASMQLASRAAGLLLTAPGTRYEGLRAIQALLASPVGPEAAPRLGRATDDPTALVQAIARTQALDDATAAELADSLLEWRVELEARSVPVERLCRRVTPRAAWTEGLSTRARRVLARLGIDELDELVAVDPRTLRTVHGCGPTVAAEICRWANLPAPTEAAPEPRAAPELEPIEIDEPACPPELASRALRSFDLSTRAHRILASLGVHDLGGLVALEPASLLAVPRCGRVTLRELEDLAAVVGLRLRSGSHGHRGRIEPQPAHEPGQEPKQAALDLSARPSGPELIPGHPAALTRTIAKLPLSPRARRLLAAAGIVRLKGLVRVAEERWLTMEGCGPGTLAELRKVARECGYELGSTTPLPRPRSRVAAPRPRDPAASVDSSAGVEREIESAVGACAQRSADRVLAWIGLRDPEAPTLGTVGIRFGCTRERIRQIVARCQRRAAEIGLELPRLHATIGELAHAPVGKDDDVAHALVAAGLASAPVAIRGVLRAAELFAVEHRVAVARTPKGTLVGTPEELALGDAIRGALRRLVEHDGCGTLTQVVRRLADRHESVDPARVRSVLDTDPRVSWLDRELGWFWMPDVRRNRVVARIDKILAVAGEIDVFDLRAALLRDRRLAGDAPPAPVLAVLCAQIEHLTVSRDGMRVRGVRGGSLDALTPNERTLVHTLRRHGPIVPIPLAIRLLVGAGMNPNTATVLLSTNPIVRRVGPDRCALVGSVRGAEPRRTKARATEHRVAGAMTIGELAAVAGMSVPDVVALVMDPSREPPGGSGAATPRSRARIGGGRGRARGHRASASCRR